MMMEQVYTLETLFEQLGLPAKPEDIDQFIREHPLTEGVMLHEAPFWTPQQAEFLRAGVKEDANWAEVVDELNLMLHKP